MLCFLVLNFQDQKTQLSMCKVDIFATVRTGAKINLLKHNKHY